MGGSIYVFATAPLATKHSGKKKWCTVNDETENLEGWCRPSILSP